LIGLGSRPPPIYCARTQPRAASIKTLGLSRAAAELCVWPSALYAAAASWQLRWRAHGNTSTLSTAPSLLDYFAEGCTVLCFRSRSSSTLPFPILVVRSKPRDIRRVEGASPSRWSPRYHVRICCNSVCCVKPALECSILRRPWGTVATLPSCLVHCVHVRLALGESTGSQKGNLSF
jgi:hypothetical protein